MRGDGQEGDNVWRGGFGKIEDRGGSDDCGGKRGGKGDVDSNIMGHTRKRRGSVTGGCKVRQGRHQEIPLCGR